MTGRFQVIIPTRDSARWSPIFLRAYRHLGIEPIYIVDRRSQDDTFERLRRERARCEVFTPGGDYIEAGALEFAKQFVDADWILRMDDDEFPSQGMLQWLGAFATSNEARDGTSIWGLSRKNLYRRDGRVLFACRGLSVDLEKKQQILNPQFRFYNKNVAYAMKIHTPGFELDHWSYAPPSACILHFDCLLRTVEERLCKVRRYEMIEKGLGWAFVDQYLPELLPDSELVPKELDEDLSVLSELPLLDEGRLVVCHCADIRLLVDGLQTWRETSVALAFAARSDRWALLVRRLPERLVSLRVAEAFCTVEHALRKVGARLPNHTLGSALYQRAMSVARKQ